MAAYESADHKRVDCIVAENELSLATQAEIDDIVLFRLFTFQTIHPSNLRNESLCSGVESIAY